MDPMAFLSSGCFQDPQLDYERILEQRLHKEALFLLMDRVSYMEHKSNLNLWGLYAQEIRVRTEGEALLRFKLSLAGADPLYAHQLQILEKEKSRFIYLLDELTEKIRTSPGGAGADHWEVP